MGAFGQLAASLCMIVLVGALFVALAPLILAGKVLKHS